MPAAARWMALSASHGRAEWPERPWKVQVALTLPRQPAWMALAVGSITTTRSAYRSPASRSSRGAERALGDRELLAPEEHVAEVDRRGAPRQRQLDHDRHRALHVGGAQAVHRLGVAPARAVALSGDGVEVAREEDERALAALRRAGQHAGVAGVARIDAAGTQDLEDVRGQRGLVARLRRDVDELERARGEAIGQGHAPARYPASGGGARRPRRTAAPDPAGPGRRACWASCRAGACAAG